LAEAIETRGTLAAQRNHALAFPLGGVTIIHMGPRSAITCANAFRWIAPIIVPAILILGPARPADDGEGDVNSPQ
jgi:hypothetical protein